MEVFNFINEKRLSHEHLIIFTPTLDNTFTKLQANYKQQPM